MDGKGGAAIGAYGLHRAMLSKGVDSTMLVVIKTTNDPTVRCVSSPARWLRLLIHKMESFLLLFQRTPNKVTHTLNILPTGLHRLINRTDIDIVQLHWIGKNTISIGEIAKIRKPVVWKMPDMWAFSGAEHYTIPGETQRYKAGYTHANRQKEYSGLDINGFVWKYKNWCWRNRQISIVGTSNWIAECASESALFREQQVQVINNPIDLELFRPVDKFEVRRRLGISETRRVILFGSWHAGLDRRKGYDKLMDAITSLAKLRKEKDLLLLIFGAEGRPMTAYFDLDRYSSGIEEMYLGELPHGNELRDAYNAADVYVTPSLLEGFGLTAAESLACGTPVVCFDTSGLKDIVDHKKNGYRAQCYDTEDLAKGINWVLNQDSATLSREAVRKAQDRFNRDRAVASYLHYYRKILAADHQGNDG